MTMNPTATLSTKKYLSGSARILSIIGLSIATFLITLDYSIANVSLPYISGDLAVSVDQGTYIITSFAVGNAIILPMTGWLTKRIGTVRLLLLSILGFVFFSWLCGASLNFNMLIFSRFFQGVVAGPLIPLSQTILITTNPPEKKNSVIAIWSMIIIVGPILGPVLGGWITFDFIWRWIFYINVPMGVFSAFLIWMYLRPYETEKEKKPVDIIGFILLFIAVTSLQIILDKGEQFDWFKSHIIVILSVISLLGFIYLFIWEKYHHSPLIELSLLKIKTYSVSIFYLLVMYSNYFGAIVLVPLWLQNYMGYTSLWAGIAVAPVGLAPIVFAQLSGKMVTKYGAAIPLFICFLLFASSCFYSAYFATNVDIKHVWISRFILGCGLSFFITPLIALSAQDIPTDKLPSATGFFHFVRAMFGGVGTSIYTTMWERRQAFHHERIGESITTSSTNFNQFVAELSPINLDLTTGIELINKVVTSQSAMMAINDVFYFMGWIFIGLVLFLPMARKRTS